MTEDVYVSMRPALTKEVRYGRGERQMEMEERGEREEPIEDIYLTPDDQEPIITSDDQPHIYATPEDFDPGTQQDAAQNNTAEEPLGGSEDSKLNRYIAAAVCVGLGLLLLAGIIILVILYSLLIKEKHNLQSSFDQLQTRLNNMTEQKDQWKTSFDQLQTRLNNMAELKRMLCESHGFTFGDGVCYYLSTEKKTWEESRTYCTAKQSDLMIIKSKEKQDFLDRVTGRERVWLGLSDSESEGDWKWVDGTPLITPRYWHPGEPNQGFEDCAESVYGGWNNGLCTRSWIWICEIVM